MPLTKLEPRQRARIVAVDGPRDIVSRMVDMGVVKGVTLELVRKAPLGDPLEIKIHRFLLSLRREEARAITVETL